MKLFKIQSGILLLLIIFGLSACQEDCLLIKNGNNGRFYLKAPHDTSPGGIFDGVVLLIGKKGDKIYAKVDRLYEGDLDGIYNFDIKTGKISGPVVDQVEQARLISIMKSPDEYGDRYKFE